MGQNLKHYHNFDWLDLEKPKKTLLLNLPDPFHIEDQLVADAMEHGHLPKVEKMNGNTFIILRAYSAEPSHDSAEVSKLTNKIAFLVNSKRLITIHQKPFAFVGKFQKEDFEDSEALMLGIFSEMLDTFRSPLEWLSGKMDEYEKEIFLKKNGKISLQALYYQKAKARICKKTIQMTHAVLAQIEVKEKHISTLQDIRETTQHLLLHYDEVIEDAQSILNTHLSINSQRSNDVMKVLTVFSAFFLPLTFIVGVYGMNFEHMPELNLPYGYPAVWAIMAAISVLTYFWFKQKKYM